jgi:hypothetical protein
VQLTHPPTTAAGTPRLVPDGTFWSLARRWPGSTNRCSGRIIMRKAYMGVSAAVGLALIAGCGPSVDVEAEKAAILAMLEANARGALEGDVALRASLVGSEVIVASGGQIDTVTKAELVEGWEELHSGGRYVEAVFLAGPEISVSGDGTMAWAYGAGRLQYAYQDSTGAEQIDTMVVSMLDVFGKTDSGWVLVACGESGPAGEQ